MTNLSVGYIVATLAVAGAASLALPVAAQNDYPLRPIRVITSGGQGGTGDLLARLLGTRLTEALKQQVVVENRASAYGVVAGEMTAKAAPDGHTLLLLYHQHTMNAALLQKLPFHPIDDFTPITQLTTASLLLVVHPSAPVTTLPEFVNWTRDRSLNFGSAGRGSGGHMAGELYKLMTGVSAQHIPYRGTGPAMMDLLAQRYDFIFTSMQGAPPGLVRAGKLRALAVTAPSRIAAWPELPAVAESLPGFELSGWFGVVGPARLPEPIVSRLHTTIVKALHQADVRERIATDGAEPVGSTPEEFRQFMRADIAKWAKLVRETGVRLD